MPQDPSTGYKVPTRPKIVPIKPKAVKDDMTLGSIWDSNLKSMGDLLEGLKALPGAVYQGAKEILTGDVLQEIASSYRQNPGKSWGPTWEVLKEIVPFAGSQYRDKDTGEWSLEAAGKGAVRNVPMALLDALAVFGGVTTAVGKGAKLGGYIGKTTGNASLASRAAAIEAGAAKWAAAPTELAKAGIRGVEKVPFVGNVLRGLGQTANTRRFAAIWGDDKMRGATQAFDEGKALAKADIPRPLWAKADRIMARMEALNPAEWTPAQVERFEKLADLSSRRWRAVADQEVLKVADQQGALQTLTPENADSIGEAAQIDHAASRLRARKIALEEKYADEYAMWEDIDKSKSWLAPRAAKERAAALEGRMTGELTEAERIEAASHMKLVERQAEQYDLIAGLEGRPAVSGKVANQSFRPFIASSPMDPGEFFHALLAPARGMTNQTAANLNRVTNGGAIKFRPNSVDYHYLQSSHRIDSIASSVKRVFSEFGTYLKHGDPMPKGHVEAPLPLMAYLDHERLAVAVARKSVAKNMVNAVEGTDDFAAALEKTFAEIGDELVKTDATLEGMAKKTVEQGRVVLPEDVARALAQELEPIGPIGRMYDSAMDMWRSVVLEWSPRFYVNNLIGNAVLQVMYGVSPFQYKAGQFGHLAAEIERAGAHLSESPLLTVPAAGKAFQGIRDGQEWLARFTDGVGRGNVAIDAAWQEVKKLSRISEPFASLEATGVKAAVESVFEARDLMRKLGIEEMTVRTSPSDIRKMLDARGGTGANREHFAKMAEVADKAIDEMERFMGAYGKETPLARKYIRRVIPFWTFASTMHQLAFWMPLVRPGRSFAYSRMSQMALDAMDDETLPEYLRGKVWLMTDRNGKMIFVSASGFNPFESIGTRRFGRIPVPKLLDPAQAPIVGAVLKGVGAYDQFAHNPPPLDRPTQVIDQLGRVWDWDPQTAKAVRVSPQTPILDIAFDLVPQTHIVNDLLASAGFATLPGNKTKVFYGPGGKPENPPVWTDAISRAFGFPTMRADLKSSRNAYRMQTYKYLRLLAKQAMYERNPEVRAQTLSFLADAMKELRARK